MITSSPSSTVASKALKITCFAPFPTVSFRFGPKLMWYVGFELSFFFSEISSLVRKNTKVSKVALLAFGAARRFNIIFFNKRRSLAIF